ncbi:hypothetical protein KR074_002321, partial [Drosophila pseudoananassae]
MGLLSGVPPEMPVAKWYRGLSLIQIQAANDLADAAQFDLEVNDSERTRNCLLRLGIRPLPRRGQLTRIVKISRAQSLALLFFLFQMHYNIDKLCRKYSVNGQLLLSAIAYLDLPPTFKALDKILPLPEKNSIKKDVVVTSRKSVPERRILGQNGGNLSPYFQKQPRPKVDRQDKRFVTKPPPFTVEIPNENPDTKEVDKRWFSDYKLQPFYRHIKATIKSELCRLFDKLDDAPQHSVKGSSSEELCKFHEEARSLERQAFLVDQRKRYLEMVDVGAREKRLTRDRIIKHLNRDVDEYLKKFGDKGWSPGMPSIRKVGCLACTELVHVSLESPPKVLCMTGERTRLYESNGPQFRLCGGGVSNSPSLQQPNEPLTSYFRSPKLHVPYVFNYSQIFESEKSKTLGTSEIIEREVVKSLIRSDDDEQIGDHSTNPIRRQHIDQALCRCVRRIFEKSLLVANTASNQPEENCLSNLKNKVIDPNDDHLMDRMLGDAFQTLRQDKELVLASLPDAHQIPDMREWIKRRFGKQYGLQSKRMHINTSTKMLQNLDLIDELRKLSAIIDPLLIQYAPISFGMYGPITKSAKLFKEKVREDVLQLMLKRTRDCWQVLHGLRAKNQRSLREIFFTYMPSSPRDGGPTMSPYFTVHPR